MNEDISTPQNFWEVSSRYLSHGKILGLGLEWWLVILAVIALIIVIWRCSK